MANPKKLYSITHRNNNGVRAIDIKQSQASYTKSTIIFPSPTGNCQVSTIGPFCNISNLEKDYLIETLLYIRANVLSSPLLLIDLKLCNVKDFENKIKPDWIKFKILYKSTNGSNMVMMMIQLSKVKHWKEEVEEEKVAEKVILPKKVVVKKTIVKKENIVKAPIKKVVVKKETVKKVAIKKPVVKKAVSK